MCYQNFPLKVANKVLKYLVQIMKISLIAKFLRLFLHDFNFFTIEFDFVYMNFIFDGLSSPRLCGGVHGWPYT